MDSPVRQYQKQKDYLRHKLFRKIRRRREAERQQAIDAPIKEMRRRVRRFQRGKEKEELPYPLRTSADYDENYLLTTNVQNPFDLRNPNFEYAGAFNRTNTNAPEGLFDDYDAVYYGIPGNNMVGAYPAELVVPNPNNYKSLLGNNGNFDFANRNIFKVLISPLMGGASFLPRLYGDTNDDKLPKFAKGRIGGDDDPVEIAKQFGLSLIPFHDLITEDIPNIIEDPSLANIGWAALGLGTDVASLFGIGNLVKLAKASRKAAKISKSIRRVGGNIGTANWYLEEANAAKKAIKKMSATDLGTSTAIEYGQYKTRK